MLTICVILFVLNIYFGFKSIKNKQYYSSAFSFFVAGGLFARILDLLFK